MKLSKWRSVIAAVIIFAFITSLTACGSGGKKDNKSADTSDTANVNSANDSSENGDSSEKVDSDIPVPGTKYIDFEDGRYDFVQVSTATDSSDVSTLSVQDYNNSKALKAVNTSGNKMYIGINAAAVLGKDIDRLAKVQFDIGVESSDKQFYAASGFIYTYTGKQLSEKEVAPWSIYLETNNPKTIDVDVSGFVKDAGNYFIISKETDVAAERGAGAQNLYIDNIRFMDENGYLIDADSTLAPEQNAKIGQNTDRFNLFGMKQIVAFEGFDIGEEADTAKGKEMPEEIVKALVPGSVVEIEFTSDTKNIWLVFPDYEGGSKRVGVESAYVNNSGNVAQITYEMLAASLGEDVSKWGKTMQCESDGKWHVSSVKVGQKASNYFLKEATDFKDYKVNAAPWTANGKELTPEIKEALVPGSMIEISYKSDTGNIWLVFPDSKKGKVKVGALTQNEENDSKKEVDNKEDDSKDSEAEEKKSDDSETEENKSEGSESEENNSEGSESEENKSEGSESQEEGDTSGENNEEGTDDATVSDAEYIISGSKAYISFEALSAKLGDDVSEWGKRLQCESDGQWEVYGIRVGTPSEFIPTNNKCDIGVITSGGAYEPSGVILSEEALSYLVPGSYINVNYTSESGELWIVFLNEKNEWTRVGAGEFVDGGQDSAVYDGSICQIPFEMIEKYCGKDVSKWGPAMKFEASTPWSVTGASIGLKEGVTASLATVTDAAKESPSDSNSDD